MADMGKNVLEISGEENQLRRFREIADETVLPLSKRDPFTGEDSSSVLSFHRLYPIPDEVIAIGYDPKGGGYDWQMKHWGVKWSASYAKREEGRFEDGKLALSYTFDTPWEPPIAWLEKASADYPLLRFELSFRYEINNWVDEYVFQDGKQIEEDE